MDSSPDNKNSPDDKEILYNFVYDRYWMIFQRSTAILSSSSRQLALGMGGVSIFGNPTHHTHHKCLLIVLLFLLVFFFLLDSAQYFSTSFRFKRSATKLDEKIKYNEITQLSKLELEPGMIDLSLTCYYLKLVLLFSASIIFLINSVLWLL